jgi:hypothetical protein
MIDLLAQAFIAMGIVTLAVFAIGTVVLGLDDELMVEEDDLFR